MKYRKNAVWAVAMLLHAPDYLLLPRTDFGRFIGCPTWPDESAPPFFVGEGNIAHSFVIGVTPNALPKAEYVFLTYPNSDKGCPPACEVWRNSIPLQYKKPPKGQDNFKLVRHIRVLIIQGSNVFNTALIISLSLCSAVILIALLL